MAQAATIPAAKTVEVPAGHPAELRRDVTIWGSYTWGYAEVDADIYVALGLVISAAQGGAPLAFALAGLVYIMIGLVFTELASSYPVAGGGRMGQDERRDFAPRELRSDSGQGAHRNEVDTGRCQVLKEHGCGVDRIRVLFSPP